MASGGISRWLILLALSALGSIETAEGTLRLVTALWRHGDRSPAAGTFPTDTGNNASTWPQGFGELTEVYIRSTRYNRTIHSAMSALSGMYYPTRQSNIPIPVHNLPREMDPMLWMEYPCPSADHIYRNEILQSDEVKRIEAENRILFDFIVNKTGRSTMTLHNAMHVWDPLNCERIHNFTHQWPDWMNESIFMQLANLTDISYKFYYHDRRLQRLRGGLLFNDIATRMDAKVNRSKALQDLKFYAYSVHDTTLTALMENLGVFDGHLPEYASCLLIELHEDPLGSYGVQTWYVNQTWPTDDPVRRLVPGCDDQSNGVCDLSTFVKLAASKAPADFDTECMLSTAKENPRIESNDGRCLLQCNSVTPIILGVTTGMILIGILIAVFLIVRGNKGIKNDQRYE